MMVGCVWWLWLVLGCYCSGLHYALGVISNPCPSLNIEVDEHFTIGSAVFRFRSDAVSLVLIPRDPDLFQDFLILEKEPGSEEMYSVTLNRELDLNLINPQPAPIPQTEEKLSCEYDPPRQRAKATVRALQYELRCSITLAHTIVEVSSDVRVVVRDVNDNAPQFLCAPYYKTLSEMTPVGSTVFRLKGLAADLDIDGGIAAYSIQGGDEFSLSGAATEGFIVVTQALDYDFGSRLYAVNVSATDIGDPPQSSWARLYITVSDGDDLNPVFEHDIHYLALPEHTIEVLNHPFPSSPILRAYDMDLGINATVAYTIESGHILNSTVYFDIESDTGNILPLRILNRTERPQYVLKIKAYQTDNPRERFSYATLVVTVEDSNVHEPELSQGVYTVSLVENPALGAHVLTVQATDKDEGINAKFAYYAIDPGGVFEVNPSTGLIYVRDPSQLDRELQTVHNFSVYAEEVESLELLRSESSEVIVTLIDVNDNHPVFQSEAYHFKVNKSVPTSYMLGQVHATDLDEGPNAEVRYTILFGTSDADSRFTINDVTGVITTVTSLSDPFVKEFVLTVEARDSPHLAVHSRSTVASVHISVLSFNENPPEFLGAPYITSIVEASTVGATVLVVQAVDEDLDSLEYSIEREPDTGQFLIDPLSGVITVDGHLDHEQYSFYTLYIAVSDGKHSTPSLVNISIVDINDNDPVFQQGIYAFSVLEEGPSTGSVGYVQARDADAGSNADITYSIAGQRASKYFSIDGTSGELSTVQSLDREAVSSHTVLVVAQDQGSPGRSTTAEVVVEVIDVNDHMPEFAQSVLSVKLPERTAAGVFYQVQATDRDTADNAIVHYTLSEGDTTLFAVDSHTGKVMTRQPMDIDLGSQTQFDLRVTAYNVQPYEGSGDTGKDTIVIMVQLLDVNDNLPVFSLPVYSFTVREDTTVGTVLGRVVAQDADYSVGNQLLSYWLYSEDSTVLDTVLVDRLTGQLRLLQSLDTDHHDGLNNIFFQIAASDLLPSVTSPVVDNVTATVNITVTDVNDNHPVFTRGVYVLEVSEDTTVGTELTTEVFATDLDSKVNGRVEYDLLTQGPFSIDRDTGSLQLSAPLDYDEGLTQYSLDIVAVDGGNPPLTGSTTVEVHVANINDNQPEFSQRQYEFEIAENQQTGSLVGSVQVTDRDRDTVYLTITGQYSDVFSIGDKGDLRVIDPLDHELTQIYVFSLVASEALDSEGSVIKSPQSTEVVVTVHVIDVNDNPPVFEYREYEAEVLEATSNQTVTKVAALDADSGAFGSVTYSIWSGNEADMFHIDPSSGQLTIVDGAGLDYNRRHSITLTVQAVDGGDPGLQSLTLVKVTVLDVNNHPPHFTSLGYTAQILENEPAGTHVIQIRGQFNPQVLSASDEDPTDVLMYKLLNHTDVFTVAPPSGEISSRVPLDRELHAHYALSVSVTDSVHTQYATVFVSVLDTNDNSPQFSENLYEKSIATDSPRGKSLLTVSALDPDSDSNGYITYWITGTAGKFWIDPDTGMISVVESATDPEYNMVVFARDHGFPPRTSRVQVVFYLNDTNKDPPVFDEFGYTVTLPEDAPAGGSVLRVEVISSSESILLKLTEGNEKGIFQMEQTGDLVLMKGLDFEEQKYHTLRITASDTLQQTTDAYIRVSVTDVNDNVPEFRAMPSVIHMIGPVGDGEFVFQVFAVDPEMGQLEYALISGASNFRVDALSGAVHTERRLEAGTYVMKVQVQDSGEPRLGSSLELRVAVLGAGAATPYPLFNQTLYSLRVREGVEVPTQLWDFNTSVSGGAVDEDVLYELSGGDTGYFMMDNSTGELYLTTPIDRETSPSLTLVVTATNLLDQGYSSHTLVVLSVSDLNDEAPQFPFTGYEASVREDAPVGEVVMVIEAFDEDLDSVLFYQIVTQDSVGLFSMDSVGGTGVVRVAASLDRETMSPQSGGVYSVQIGVSDGPHAGQATWLTVHVIDVNDNPPVFNASVYNVSIYEDVSPCHEVVQVEAVDPDLVDEDNVVYSISQGNEVDLFSIGNQSGVVSLSCEGQRSLDRERWSAHTLTVLATDTGGNVDNTTVYIQVLDVNDQTPVFIGEPYETTVFEGDSSLTLTVQLLAEDTDMDHNAQLTYFLEDGEQTFVITTVEEDSLTVGLLQVVRPLDRERPGLQFINGTAVYTLTVYVRDSGTPSRIATTLVTVYIEDINDHPPQFEHTVYEVSISEATPVDTPVLTVRATDTDLADQLHYSLQAQANDGTFVMESETGTLLVHRPLDLSRQSQYILTAVVDDGVFTSTALLRVSLIDVNDQDPVFQQTVYYFSVPENDRTGVTGQQIGQVSAVDGDSGLNGQVTYTITSRNAQGVFNIPQPSTGVITLVGSLDRETDDHFYIIMTASDAGQPPRISTCEVEIEVEDVNDNAPVFVSAPYTGEVLEHSPGGATVFVYPAPYAVDLDEGSNAEITYKLTGSAADLFDLDPVTGELTVSGQGSGQLDRETQDSYTLQILAIDGADTSGSLTATTSVTVRLADINDHQPVFEQTVYEFSASEVTSSGTPLGRVVAHDGDIPPNDRLQYGVVSGAQGKFYVDRLSGDIYTAGPLDRETQSSYTINISASDRGVLPHPLEGYTLLNITLLDFNDNAPVIDPNTLEFSIQEEVKGHNVGQVKASDLDEGENGVITFRLLDAGPFRIDAKSGSIESTQSLDRESQAVHTVTVVVEDSGRPMRSSTAILTVYLEDVNDNTPEFEQDIYMVNILERSPVGSVVLYPKAFDPDVGRNSNISYSMAVENPAAEYFQVDPRTGMLSVGKVLDRSGLIQHGVLAGFNDTTFTLTLLAEDQGQRPLTGEVKVYVNIDEVMHDSPQFVNSSYRVDLMEELPAGVFVTRVEAVTKDPSTRITYRLTGSQHFTIADQDSGEVTTTGSRLDREVRSHWSFTVQAVDNRTPHNTAYTMVLVTLLDINDHAPVFDRDVYQLSIVEGLYTQPVSLGQVHATDLDVGDNGQVSFSVVDSQPETRVIVDRDSGEVSVAGDLDWETHSQLELSLTATDHGGDASLSTTVRLVIHILDTNDNAPEFIDLPQVVQVSRSLAVKSQICRVKAEDPDMGVNGTVMYDLVVTTGQDDLPFYMQTTGGVGVVKLASSLQLEPHSLYTVTVTAYDLGQPPLTTTSTLLVNITDSRDESPQFDRQELSIRVAEDTPVSAVLVTLSAGLGDYYYRITDGPAAGFLRLDSVTGTLRLSRSLTESRQDTLWLTVTAMDVLDPLNSDSIQVTIDVIRQYPTFSQPVYEVTLTENQAPPRLLLDLNTTEEMLGDEVHYFLMEDDYTGMFKVENSTGRLWCNQMLDRELTAQFRLKVGCRKLTTTHQGRQRRNTPGVGEAEVVVSVGDVNDNPPTFPTDPLVYGIPLNAPTDYAIVQIQAEDADSGNNSLCMYTIESGPDEDLFYVEPFTGVLRSTEALLKSTTNKFSFRLRAVDDWGKGHLVEVNVKVFTLTDDDRAILVAGLPLTDFIHKQDSLIGNLSIILGWQIQVERLEPHIDVSEGTSRIDITRSDLYFYAVDLETDTIVPRATVIKRIEERSSAIDELFNIYRIEEVKPVVVSSSDTTLDRTVIIIIIVACLVFFLALIACVVVCLTNNKSKDPGQQKRQMPALLAALRRSNKPTVQMSNPTFQDSSLFADTLDIDEEGNTILVVDNGSVSGGVGRERTWSSTYHDNFNGHCGRGTTSQRPNSNSSSGYSSSEHSPEMVPLPSTSRCSPRFEWRPTSPGICVHQSERRRMRVESVTVIPGTVHTDTHSTENGPRRGGKVHPELCQSRLRLGKHSSCSSSSSKVANNKVCPVDRDLQLHSPCALVVLNWSGSDEGVAGHPTQCPGGAPRSSAETTPVCGRGSKSHLQSGHTDNLSLLMTADDVEANSRLFTVSGEHSAECILGVHADRLTQHCEQSSESNELSLDLSDFDALADCCSGQVSGDVMASVVEVEYPNSTSGPASVDSGGNTVVEDGVMVRCSGDLRNNIDSKNNVHNNGDLQNKGDVHNNGDLQNSDLHNNGDLQNKGDLHNNGDLQNKGDLHNNGDLQNKGDVHNNGDLQNKGDLHNNGDLQNSDLHNNGDLQNSGDLHSNGDLQNSGDLHNNGDLQNSDLHNNGDLQNSDLHNNGDLQNSDLHNNGVLKNSDLHNNGDPQISDDPKISGDLQNRPLNIISNINQQCTNPVMQHLPNKDARPRSPKKQVTFQDIPGESCTDSVIFSDISNCTGDDGSIQSNSDSQLYSRHNARNSRLVAMRTGYELADTYF